MLKFELNIADRKTLANRMEELTGIHPYYTRAPLYAYDIGNYTIDRDGNLLVEPENADAELLTTLLNEGLIRVRDARENAKLNHVKNIRFVCADAGDFMVDMANAGEHCDVLFMDPPRAGSDTAFLSCALTLAPRRIVYVSCNPETLARDLNFLTKRGYRAEKIQPVDMFPHTDHVETVVLLSRAI